MAKWYYCLRHHTVEEGRTCRADERLGPYDSAEEARQWRDRVAARDESWHAADEAWHEDGAER